MANDKPGPQGYGALLEDVPRLAAPGDQIEARFQASHPRNDLMLNDSYAFAERREEDGRWRVVATDRHPDLLYTWHPEYLPPLPLDLPFTAGASEATVSWKLPRNLASGHYRLRAKGVASPGGPWEGVSGALKVEGVPSRCP